jgi:hypothetical protein
VFGIWILVYATLGYRNASRQRGIEAGIKSAVLTVLILVALIGVAYFLAIHGGGGVGGCNWNGCGPD